MTDSKKPDKLQIIDLDQDQGAGDAAPEQEREQEAPAGKPRGWRRFVNVHTGFLLLLVGIISFIAFRLSNWGEVVDIDEFFQHNELITDGEDSFDVYAPLTDAEGNIIANKSPHSILFFGNSPFADDRDSENGVVNRIAKETGATVYNCSVADSYLAAKSDLVYHTYNGLDVYNFYWLCIYLTWDEPLNYFDWLEENPDAQILPETQEVRRLLETVDMDTVDTIAIMYDGADYLAGSTFHNPENNTDIQTFCGNLEAGIEVLQKKYPHIRIIVLSPTYAFGIDDNGEYVSSDIKVYEGGETLSDYVLKECESAVRNNCTFIDNIYGTFNEDQASEYLTDNLHLNQAGRELLVERFIRALTYFDK